MTDQSPATPPCEAQLQAIMAASTDAMMIVDAGGHVTAWNKRAEQLFGLTTAEAVGQHADDVLRPADPRHIEGTIGLLLDAGERIGGL
jgi:PAS domain S-box-containing protein